MKTLDGFLLSPRHHLEADRRRRNDEARQLRHDVEMLRLERVGRPREPVVSALRLWCALDIVLAIVVVVAVAAEMLRLERVGHVYKLSMRSVRGALYSLLGLCINSCSHNDAAAAGRAA